jgi:hypothetical protein
MKLRYSLLAGLAVASIGGAAFAADNDTEIVNVGGNVARLCVLGSPSPASVDLGALADTSGARTGKLTTISNRTVNLPNSWCNFAGTHLTVTVSALLAADATPVQTGFARAVNYTGTVNNWAATPAAATSAATAAGATPSATGNGGSLSTPKLTQLDLVLSNFSVPGDALLVAGGYAGSVTITVGPDAAQ